MQNEDNILLKFWSLSHIIKLSFFQKETLKEILEEISSVTLLSSVCYIYRIMDLGLWIWDYGYGIMDLGLGIWD